MKIVRYLGSALIIALGMTSQVQAGGLAGGGGPPSRDLLDQMLRQQSARAVLFVWDEQTYGLGLDQSLPAILPTSTDSSPDLVSLDADAFLQLEMKKHPVNAINREGATRSYRVLDGHGGTLLLIDRRWLMRAGMRP